MKEEKLLDAFGRIEEQYIEEANPEKTVAEKAVSGKAGRGIIIKKNSKWRTWGAMAASAVIIIGVVVPTISMDRGTVPPGVEQSTLENMPELQPENFEVMPEEAEAEIEEGKTFETEEWDKDATDVTTNVTNQEQSQQEGESSQQKENQQEGSGQETSTKQEIVTEAETVQEISLEKAQDIELFPRKIVAGYELTGSVTVYNKHEVVAKFYHAEFEDELTVQVFDKEWFCAENDDVDFNRIQYEGAASYMYLESPNKIVRYTFSNSDIAQHTDFFDMVYSFSSAEKNPVINEN